MKELTNSSVTRQNILNNQLAVAEEKKFINFQDFLYLCAVFKMKEYEE